MSTIVTSSGLSVLDRPAWSALTGGHASLALGGDYGRRYPQAMAVFAGITDAAEHQTQALAELAAVTAPGESLVIMGGADPLPLPEWAPPRTFEIVQMVCPHPISEHSASTNAISISPLTPDDSAEMLALVKLTEPGPFFARTIELGHYYGIREGGQLVAMAGERLFPTGFREISAVCTHPDYQKRGYARRLVTHLVSENFAAGRVPFLHTGVDNSRAITLYESLGFVLRTTLRFHLLRRR